MHPRNPLSLSKRFPIEKTAESDGLYMEEVHHIVFGVEKLDSKSLDDAKSFWKYLADSRNTDKEDIVVVEVISDCICGIYLELSHWHANGFLTTQIAHQSSAKRTPG
jgi:hypothetical protein